MSALFRNKKKPAHMDLLSPRYRTFTTNVKNGDAIRVSHPTCFLFNIICFLLDKSLDFQSLVKLESQFNTNHLSYARRDRIKGESEILKVRKNQTHNERIEKPSNKSLENGCLGYIQWLSKLSDQT